MASHNKTTDGISCNKENANLDEKVGLKDFNDYILQTLENLNFVELDDDFEKMRSVQEFHESPESRSDAQRYCLHEVTDFRTNFNNLGITEASFPLYDILKVSDSLKEESNSWFSETKLLHHGKTFAKTQNYIVPLFWDENKNNQTSDSDDEIFFKKTFVNSYPALGKPGNKSDLEVVEIEDFDRHKINFTSLPDEIKIRIFSFLTEREICRYVAPVCNSWLQYSKDSTLWKSILYKEFKDVESHLLVNVILSWCQNITVLELNKRDDITFEEFCKIFQCCPHIEILSLTFCIQVTKETLCLLPMHCKKLHTISLEGCRIYDESFYSLYGLPIRSISLPFCYQVSDEGALFLVNNFKNLVEINLDGIQWITERFIEKLVKYHFQTLEKIHLDGENLTDYAINLICQCQKLRLLSLSFCTSLTDAALLSISRCRKLKYLQLRKGEHFTNKALLSYLQGMEEEQSLRFKHLSLAECTEISDECLKVIGEKFPGLEMLSLSWCWEVSDEGLKHIVENCSKLTELHLQGLHELDGYPLESIKDFLPSLKFLDLTQCNKVQDELLEVMVQSMKDLEVVNYYGESLDQSSKI